MKQIQIASIYLYNTCNYKCSYCTAAQSIDNRLNKFSRAVTKEGMKQILDFFNQRDQWHILYAGGEPTIHPYFIEFTKELSKNHYLRMATNNSMDFEKLNRFVNEINPERFDYIQCSLQEEDEESNRFNKFLERAKILKSSGFKVFVTYVAVPDRLETVKRYYDIFMSNNIPFVIQTFRGKYKGLTYPHDYNSEQREFLDKYMISAMYRAMVDTDDRKPTGKPCNAGYKRIYIDGITGNIYRCLLEVTKDIGNIYENKVNFDEKPFICRAKTCTCVFEPHMELEDLLYEDLENILNSANKYDKRIYEEYKEKSLPGQIFNDYWSKRQEDILKRIFKNAKGKNIGIYGTGKHTENMLKAYKKLNGDIDFNLFFFDSNREKWGSEYLNSKIYPPTPDSIEALKLDRIIISSHRFQDEIYRDIVKYQGVGIDIIKIYDKDDTIVFI